MSILRSAVLGVSAVGFFILAACSSSTNDVTTEAEATGARRCGGFAGLLCPTGQTCVDDPSDSCDPSAGGRDCMGTCTASRSRECGGFLGLQCPAGESCVDDPSDSCDPRAGGADCGGICVAGPTRPACASIRCAPGFACVEPTTSGSSARCEPISKCAAVLCAPGTRCVETVTGASCQPDGPTVPKCAAIRCAAGFHCQEPANPTDPAACVADKTVCGGRAGLPCPTSQACVDDPSDSCDPSAGGADCSGICVDVAVAVTCAGKIGAACPAGTTCVDDPTDACDPAAGGADCGGICVAR